MEMRKLFNKQTRDAVVETQEGYVSKDTDEYDLIRRLKSDYSLEQVFRFDIGKHTDGYSDLIEDALELNDIAELSRQNLIEYPDNHYNLLRNRLAMVYDLDPDWFVISNGLEQVIDHISRVFMCPDAGFIMPVPNFSVFAEFCKRMGGSPIYLPLRPEDNFQWTEKSVYDLGRQMKKQTARLLWISNPANPTGQYLPLEWIEQLVAIGAKSGVAVVVDEAYGEYTDSDQGIISATRFVATYPNLMVLRTFSKIHALPSLRVGYLMCSNQETLNAIKLYRPMFPFSWFSLFVAQIASIDEEHPQEARRCTQQRKERLYKQLQELKNFDFLPSSTNTLMLRSPRLKAIELWERLAAQGILTANLSNINGLQGWEFLRMTIRAQEENDLFIEACRKIDRELRII